MSLAGSGIFVNALFQAPADDGAHRRTVAGWASGAVGRGSNSCGRANDSYCTRLLVLCESSAASALDRQEDDLIPDEVHIAVLHLYPERRVRIGRSLEETRPERGRVIRSDPAPPDPVIKRLFDK